MRRLGTSKRAQPEQRKSLRVFERLNDYHTQEADAGRGYVRVKKHDRVMRYSFIRTEQEIWVKFFTNSAHRAIVPAVKLVGGTDLYAFFEEDIRQLELASHD